MMKTEEINCTICGSDEYEVLYKEGRDNVPINFSICKNCGLTYLNPRWTKESYNEYYATEYDGDYRSEDLKPELNSAKYNSVKQLVDRTKREGVLTSAPKNVLDIGAGMGWSSVYLKENVYQDASYHAIEPSLHCQENMQKHGIEILTNDIDSEWESSVDTKFDLIIMRHVLEHFMNPVEVLKKVREVLADDGVLYIAVPNADNPKYPVKETYFRVVHTYYFNPYSFRNCLNLAGLNTDNITTKDKGNPYELFAFCTKSDVLNADIDRNEHERYKRFLNEKLAKEKSVFGRMSIVLKRKLSKVFK